jgi:hypothetical protein
MPALGAEIAHSLAHADSGGDGAIRRLEGRRDCIPNGLHDGTSFRGNDLLMITEAICKNPGAFYITSTIAGGMPWH